MENFDYAHYNRMMQHYQQSMTSTNETPSGTINSSLQPKSNRVFLKKSQDNPLHVHIRRPELRMRATILISKTMKVKVYRETQLKCDKVDLIFPVALSIILYIYIF